MKQETIKFKELLDETAKLYLSLDINTFQLGSVKFEVIEDEQDGYRSSMECVAILKKDVDLSRSEFIADVKIVGSEMGYKLVDTEDNHVLLEFGTDNADDYYPSFTFRWMPKTPTDEIIKLIKQ